VADFHEAARQDVLYPAPQELLGRQRHHPAPAARRVVLREELHGLAVE
jgi:hypothetical protein